MYQVKFKNKYTGDLVKVYTKSFSYAMQFLRCAEKGRLAIVQRKGSSGSK